MLKKYAVETVLILLVSGGVAMTAAQETQSPEKHAVPTLAVNNLTSHGLTESEVMTLTDVLRSRLMETKKFKVMERSEMESILREQAFQQSGACTEEACIVEMGQLLGIEQILAGSIGKVGKAFSINVRIISVRSGEIMKSVSHNYTGPIENLLTSEMTVVAKKIAGVEMAMVPVVENKPVAKKNNKFRRRFIIGTVAVLAVGGGGVAAYLLLQDDNEPVSSAADVEVEWTF